jgi:aldehyde:ferredoxin oxidoreductase
MIKGGYMGKILRVDLSKQKIEDEALPNEDVLRKYVGGTGLALKYLYDEAPPSIDPLDPESPLIFMNGPLTGTMWPCSSRYSLVSIDANYPKSAGNSWGGGFWAARLKWEGYDGIIIKGKCSKPSYLFIQRGKIELRDASHLWGKKTRETENLIREELGNTECSIACIGPAGERCLPASIVLTDTNHVAAKSGAGQIMGSKLLKAIVVSGRGGPVPLADTRKFIELALEYRGLVKGGSISEVIGDGGCIVRYGKLAKRMLLAFKNYTDPLGQLEWGRELDQMMAVSKMIPRPCFNCPIGCAQDIIVGKGPYKGYRSRMGGGGQWEGLAGAIGVMEGSTVVYLTDYLNDIGCEAGIVGAVIALLYDCYERGLIDKEFTDGLELNWGNADACLKLLDKYVRQEGIGQLIAKGQKELAKIIGKGADQLLSGYKGAAIHHDHRASWELMLGKVVSTTTAMEGIGVDNWACEPDLGYPEKPPPFDREKAPERVRLTQVKNRLDNCVGICVFSLWSVPGSLNKYVPSALKYAVGWDFDREEAFLLGERVCNLARMISLKRGLTKEDDMDIGPIFLDGFKEGEFKDKPIRPHLPWMVSKYYEYMGWDPETGIPYENTLERLGMQEMIEDVRKLKGNSAKR